MDVGLIDVSTLLKTHQHKDLTVFFNLVISQVIHFDFKFTDVIKNNICANAALNGNLEVLKWARENCCPWCPAPKG